jgi:hypothetical protein
MEEAHGQVSYRTYWLAWLCLLLWPLSAQADDLAGKIRVTVLPFETKFAQLKPYEGGMMDSLITGLQHVPQFIYAYYNSAIVLETINRKKDAILSWKKFLELAANDPQQAEWVQWARKALERLEQR